MDLHNRKGHKYEKELNRLLSELSNNNINEEKAPPEPKTESNIFKPEPEIVNGVVDQIGEKIKGIRIKLDSTQKSKWYYVPNKSKYTIHQGISNKRLIPFQFKSKNKE